MVLGRALGLGGCWDGAVGDSLGSEFTALAVLDVTEDTLSAGLPQCLTVKPTHPYLLGVLNICLLAGGTL